jgi:hypothetical protein
MATVRRRTTGTPLAIRKKHALPGGIGVLDSRGYAVQPLWQWHFPSVALVTYLA